LKNLKRIINNPASFCKFLAEKPRYLNTKRGFGVKAKSKSMKNKKLNSATKQLKLAMRQLFKKIAKNYSK